METKLNLITEMSLKDRRCRFTNLVHMLNIAGLKECFYMLKKGKASGIDGISFEEYERDIDNNLKDLVGRMKRQAYKPKPVMRAYIPKSDGGKRPLGLPSIEDKVVQKGISRILKAIYEVDFLDCSYGYRPKRSSHHALDKVDKIIMQNPINHIIDADIKGFFDNVNHEWMMRCLKERINDTNLLRLIARFLRAGVMEEGNYHDSDTGTPQGGIISPILSNIYLHYVLDLWIEKAVKKDNRGIVEIVRYADDFIILVQYKDNAGKIIQALKERLKKFGLELAEDKTKIVAFGRYAVENARHKGERPDTFEFLGFTHFSDKTRKGGFKVGRKTMRKRFILKIKEMNKWLRNIRNAVTVKVWWKVLCAKLRGHFQYYGISGNYRYIKKFYWFSIRLVFKWLNRRSQKKSFNWQEFLRYVERYRIPKPKIYHNFYTLYGY